MFLLVFSTRSAALRVKARLDREKIYSRAVSTPMGIGRGCGISLEVYGVPYRVVASFADGAAGYLKTSEGWSRISY